MVEMRRGLFGLKNWLRLVSVMAAAVCSARAAEPGLPSAAEIDSILRQLAAITGFQIHRQLPFEMVTRDQVNQFLKRQIRASVKPEEVRAEEITLKKFGFVPGDFDLKQNTIDLLTEQAAAFYDFRRKKLFISDWASRNMRDEALVHELAHALADQNYPIRKFLAAAGEDSESSLARESVVEGQASWLMLEYEARRNGRTLADPETSKELLRAQMDSEDAAYPVFSKAPLYIRATLMFPYDDGGRFQQILFEHDHATAFARPFEQPPATTAQVIHPARYFAREQPAAPPLPKRERHTKSFVTGTMGELDHRILLRQYVDRETSDGLSPKLRNASYRIDQLKSSHRFTLSYASEWQDDAAAGEFFRAYRKVLSAKWKRVEVASESDTAVRGRGDDGFFELTRRGSTVISQEGFAQAFDESGALN